jgi:mannitol/fructose-specific phosphotransferase system IIA component (Ntr-type)
MNPSTRTPEGQPNRCPVCGKPVVIEPSQPPGDAPCPHCGCLLWFPTSTGRSGIYGFLTLSISDRSIRTKVSAISAIVDRLVGAGAIELAQRPGILAAILKREELSSTGIGRGVAVPHAKYEGIASLFGAVAHFPEGVEFDSLDREPVNTVYLFVSPADRPGDHLRVLEAISRRIRETA